MRPAFMTKDELLDILDELRELVAADDSFEGRLSYTCLDLEDGDPVGFRVDALYRYGNSLGQGFARVVAEMPKDDSENKEC